MSKIAGLTEGKLWIIKETLAERYGEPIEPTLADTKLHLNPHDTELDVSPTAYWEHEGCHFELSVKRETGGIAASFFTRATKCLAPALKSLMICLECAVTLLQVQADHAASMAKE